MGRVKDNMAAHESGKCEEECLMCEAGFPPGADWGDVQRYLSEHPEARPPVD